MSETRIERDSMGEMHVPAGAYYGAQTQRAVENFPVSGIRFPRPFIRALGLIKRSAAIVNQRRGLLGGEIAAAIVAACDEVIEGKLDDQFVLDVFQTGSGTSTNMNTNEVVANRAIEILGGEIGSKRVHPNDHVNMGQSSNDVIPTAIHVAALIEIRERLEPALEELAATLEAKAENLDHVVKSGRTHLQDATPVRLGQELGGYAAQVRNGLRRLGDAAKALGDLAIGGTAVGTGLNTPEGFGADVAKEIARAAGIECREAPNHFEAQSAKDAALEASGQLRVIATSLKKIADDVRWLASGPRCGLGEIRLPEIQPGSSIMPGKVNPVVCEAVTMVAAQVTGNDVAIALGAQGGYLELNVSMPLIARNLLESISLLAGVSRVFVERCLAGITADEDRCRELVERNLAICTALAPKLGYDTAAALSKEAFQSGRTIREVVLERGLVQPDELDALLDLRRMTEPGIPG